MAKRSAYNGITPDLKNANKGTERGRYMVEASLRETGAGRSILLDRDGRIIAGNKTFEAASDIGLPVRVVETDGRELVAVKRTDLDLSDDTGTARKLAYYDNRSGQVGLEWDVEVLLEDIGAGVDLSAMFRQDELDELLADLTPKTEGDTAPQVDRAEELRRQWGTAAGQMWQLGEHRLLCASCLESENVARLLGGETPAMIFADPPYGISVVAANGYVGGGEGPNGMIPFGGKKRGYVGGGESDSSRHGHYPIEEWKKGKRLGSANAAKPFGSKAVRGSIGAAHVVDVGKYAPIIGDETTETAVRSSSALLAQYPKAVHVWWGGNYYANTLPASSCWLVWNKETTGNFADCELAWTNQPKAAKLFTHRWNGMLRDSERERRFHPTQKPAALAAWVFDELGAAGDIILDPFCGSGPTVIAAEQMGRRVYGLEMSAEYIAIILQRWADHTGKTPVLLEA